MAKITVKREAEVVYSRTTWQGVVEIKGETIEYRYSEDNNGTELYIWKEETGWKEADLNSDNYAVLWAAIMEWGTPEDFGSINQIVDLDDEIIDDYI